MYTIVFLHSGPSRMRKRLSKNDMFYTHYPYIEQEKEQLSTKHRMAFSHDSKVLFQFCQKYLNPTGEPVMCKYIF